MAAAAGAATAIVGAVPAQVADGVYTWAEFGYAATLTVGAAVVAFAAVWRVPNAD